MPSSFSSLFFCGTDERRIRLKLAWPSQARQAPTLTRTFLIDEIRKQAILNCAVICGIVQRAFFAAANSTILDHQFVRRFSRTWPGNMAEDSRGSRDQPSTLCPVTAGDDGARLGSLIPRPKWTRRETPVLSYRHQKNSPPLSLSLSLPRLLSVISQIE